MINAIKLYRLSHWLYIRKVPVIPKLLTGIIFLIYNSYIPSSAEIGKSTLFGYGGIGVVIHSNCRIGDDCIIAQQVTIGGKSGHVNPPRIGNSVYISTGAKILGDIEIGDECVIGANAVVISDIPPRSVVAGVPAKVIKSDIKINDYL